MSHAVRIVVQARFASTRLPGKILAPLSNEPMLAHVVRRLTAAGRYTPWRLQVSVATTVEAADDATEQLCRQLAVACFRGPAEDVLERYLQATADLSDESTVIRATADNPLYCPRRTAGIVHEHLATAADYTCIVNLSYVVPEVIRVGALRQMAAVANDSYCREHVTPYFRQRPEQFHVRQLPADWQGLRPDVRLTVDTLDEYQRMTQIFAALCAHVPLVALEDVYAFCSLRRAAGERTGDELAPSLR